MNRRNFLKMGSLFLPAVAAPTVAYSFLLPPRFTLPRGALTAGMRLTLVVGVGDNEYRLLRPGTQARIVRSFALYVNGRKAGPAIDGCFVRDPR